MCCVCVACVCVCMSLTREGERGVRDGEVGITAEPCVNPASEVPTATVSKHDVRIVFICCASSLTAVSYRTFCVVSHRVDQ